MTSVSTSAFQRAFCAVLLLGLASVTALPAEADAREIIRRLVVADESNWKLARHYSLSERVDARRPALRDESNPVT